MSLLARLKMRRSLAAVVFLAAGAISGPAAACSCMMPSSPEQHLQSYPVAFLGSVEGEKRKGAAEIITRFRVSKVLKGAAPIKVQVRHRWDEAACGVRFKKGSRVLVLAMNDDKGALQTSLCALPVFSQAQYSAATSPLGRRVRTCEASGARFALGMPFSPNLAARVLAGSGAADFRVRWPGQAYTQEHRVDRVNLDLDAHSRVTRVVCG